MRTNASLTPWRTKRPRRTPFDQTERKDCKNMPEATWKPHEKHGRLTMQSDLQDSVYAFPKQRKEPLTDAQHVRNAVARFDQSHRRFRCRPCFGVHEHRESCKLLQRQARGDLVARLGHSSPKRQERVCHQVMAAGKWKSEPTKTNLEKETRYDGHKRSDRSL